MRVVQFGEGVFLRGFADWMFHRLNHEAGADIRVTLVQPRDSDGVARLMAQDGRYTVVQQGLVDGSEQSQRFVVDCIDSGLNTHREPDYFAELAQDPQVRVLLSNTTEAGIAWSDDDAALGADRERVRSFPGKLTWFLAERHSAQPDAARLFVLPCELIADNGQRLEELVRRMAAAWGLGDDFTAWLDRTVVFYDTLVDRIVPGRPVTDVPELAAGIPDEFPVQVEWFHSWYLRGPRELLDVLPLEALDFNVRFVDDLRPYRDLKVRVLNGLHSTMAPIGVAAGLEAVAEAVDHDVVGPWMRHLLETEIVPTLDLPGAEIEEFTRVTWDRFRNPFIHHRLQSILLNATAKIPSRLGDTVTDLAESGRAAALIAHGIAAWLLLTRDAALADSAEALEAMRALWRRHADGELSLESLAGQALHDTSVLGGCEWPQPFVDAVGAALRAIDRDGVEAALSAI